MWTASLLEVVFAAPLRSLLLLALQVAKYSIEFDVVKLRDGVDPAS